MRSFPRGRARRRPRHCLPRPPRCCCWFFSFLFVFFSLHLRRRLFVSHHGPPWRRCRRRRRLKKLLEDLCRLDGLGLHHRRDLGLRHRPLLSVRRTSGAVRSLPQPVAQTTRTLMIANGLPIKTKKADYLMCAKRKLGFVLKLATVTVTQ